MSSSKLPLICIVLFYMSVSFMLSKCDNNFKNMDIEDGDEENIPYKVESSYDSTSSELKRGYDLLDSATLKSAASLANYILDTIIQPSHSDALIGVVELFLNNSSDLSENLKDKISDKDVLLHLAGYIAIAFISVLILVFMPIIGLIICCCRCGGNCGGKVKEREGKYSSCCSSFCGFIMLICVAVMISMCVFMIVASFDVRKNIQQDGEVASGFIKSMESGLNDLKNYVETTLDQLEQFKVVLISTIDEIPNEVLDYIKKASGVNTLLSNIENKMQNISDLKSKEDDEDTLTKLGEIYTAFNSINTSLRDFQLNSAVDGLDDLNTELERAIPTKELKDIAERIDVEGWMKYINDSYQKDTFSFIATITISGLIVFVTACFMLGLVHGTCCRKAFPVHEYSICTKKQGSIWLLLGIALAFIFIWLLTGIDLVMVLSGGLIHTEFCRNLVELKDSSTNSFIQDNFIEKQFKVSFDISHLFDQCKQDSSLNSAFNLTNKFDLSLLLDEKKIIEQLDIIDNIDVEDIDIHKYVVDATTIDTKIDEVITLRDDLKDSLEDIKITSSVANFETTFEAFKINNEKWKDFKNGFALSLKRKTENFLDIFGKCRGLYAAYANFIDSICVKFIYTWNSFSMSLGIFIMTLTIAIFSGLKLSSLYRKTLPYSKKGSLTTSPVVAHYQNPAYVNEINERHDRPPSYNGRH